MNKTVLATAVALALGATTPAWADGGWWGGGTVHMDTPGGGAAKALLTASDGTGLRCDLRGTRSGGGGECRDDKGKEYDVQIRLAAVQTK